MNGFQKWWVGFAGQTITRFPWVKDVAYSAWKAAGKDATKKHRKRLQAMQSKIDALMLEFCPDEMTPQQLAEWGKHQVPVNDPITTSGLHKEK